MIFRRKKAPAAPDAPPVPRSRSASRQSNGSAASGGDNPLARRLQADNEPATVDLADPARFHRAPGPGDDPQTTALRKDPAKLNRVISRDPATGKFYLHPGSGEYPVLLQNEAVAAPTELRRGDIIQIGEHTLTLL